MQTITSKQMQHSSCPESGLHLCFPCSRLSRQTLHTSQWKDLSLWILQWLKATLLDQKTNTLPPLYYWAMSLCVACSNIIHYWNTWPSSPGVSAYVCHWLGREVWYSVRLRSVSHFWAHDQRCDEFIRISYSHACVILRHIIPVRFVESS